MRTCSTCGLEKPEDMFYSSRRDCKPCAKEQARRYRAANPDRVRETKRRWAAANQDKVRERRRRHRVGYYARNKEKLLARGKLWRAKNGDRVRAYHLKQYGITTADYDEMLQTQKGKCANPKCSNTKKLFVDHDHETGAVRGLLCNTCNSAIGLLQDDPEVIRGAAIYLESRTPKPTTGDTSSTSTLAHFFAGDPEADRAVEELMREQPTSSSSRKLPQPSEPPEGQ